METSKLNELIEMYVIDFIEEVARMFMDGEIDNDEVNNTILKYTEANKGDYSAETEPVLRKEHRRAIR